MLSDFLMLEAFYGPPAAGLFLEDLSLRYGIPAVKKALRAGEIIARPVLCGPDCGRWLMGLTDKGRAAANGA